MNDIGSDFSYPTQNQVARRAWLRPLSPRGCVRTRSGEVHPHELALAEPTSAASRKPLPALRPSSQRRPDGEPTIIHKRYFLHRPNDDGAYRLQATKDTPFFHHVAILAELQLAADPDKGKLYTFHFNALRSVMEKTASFFGHPSISFCLKALDNDADRALFNRALNLLSHGA